MTYGHDMGVILKPLKETIIQKPEDLDPDASKSEKYIWDLECKNYIIRREELNQGLKRLLLKLLGQFNDALKQKLQNKSKFKKR